MSYLDHIFGVAGKTVLVTGGGRGIGASIAEGFVRAGAKVYICSRRAEPALKRLRPCRNSGPVSPCRWLGTSPQQRAVRPSSPP